MSDKSQAERDSTILPTDLPEIQGFVVRGYNFEYARHFVLTIQDPASFKRVLSKLSAEGSGGGPLKITSAAPWTGGKPDYTLNIGFSWAGIQALGMAAQFGEGSWTARQAPRSRFDFQEFKRGAADEDTCNTVGDVGPSAPENWVWCLRRENAAKAHVILTLGCNDPARLEEYSGKLLQMVAEGGAEALSFGDDGAGPGHFDAHAFPDGSIHFGYKDGISQPHFQGLERPPDKQKTVPADYLVMRQYGGAVWPLPMPSEFGRNGSFSAFRILEQDVAGFQDFLANSGTGVDPDLLAAKACGRWRNGNPLELAPNEPGKPLPADQLSNFDYSQDSDGKICPISSHTRRANPRGTDDAASSTLHRIVRRANPYGPRWDPAQGRDEVPRGLVGHFICGSLYLQFEFIMHTWINGQDFANNLTRPKGKDPLLGANTPPPESVFEFPPHKVTGFQEFITTRGGLYVFLPSLPALRWMGGA